MGDGYIEDGVGRGRLKGVNPGHSAPAFALNIDPPARVFCSEQKCNMDRIPPKHLEICLSTPFLAIVVPASNP